MSRILVVEDSRTQSTVLKGTLESHGFEVTVAENGEAALEAIGRQPPHAVLTDLLDKRGPIYAMADFHVRSDAAPHGHTVDQILKALNECKA